MKNLTQRYEIRISEVEKEAIKKLKELGKDVPELIRNYLVQLVSQEETVPKIEEENISGYDLLGKEKELEKIVCQVNTLKEQFRNYQKKVSPYMRATMQYINEIRFFKEKLDTMLNKKDKLQEEINSLKKQ